MHVQHWLMKIYLTKSNTGFNLVERPEPRNHVIWELGVFQTVYYVYLLYFYKLQVIIICMLYYIFQDFADGFKFKM